MGILCGVSILLLTVFVVLVVVVVVCGVCVGMGGVTLCIFDLRCLASICLASDVSVIGVLGVSGMQSSPKGV